MKDEKQILIRIIKKFVEEKYLNKYKILDNINCINLDESSLLILIKENHLIVIRNSYAERILRVKRNKWNYFISICSYITIGYWLEQHNIEELEKYICLMIV